MTDQHAIVVAQSLSTRDRNANAVRALTKLVPFVGESLNQLAFGPIDELRAQRVEATLYEIVARLDAMGAASAKTEEYVNLLERVLPSVARAVNDDVRARFRDLLTLAAPVPAGDARWADAQLADRLLTELEAPALAILARLASIPEGMPAMIVSRPEPQVIKGDAFDWASPHLGPAPLGYKWVVVEEWCRRLREKRLVGYSSSDARGGFGGIGLWPLGRLLVEWTIAGDKNEQPET
jgi:hypothetical protein